MARLLRFIPDGGSLVEVTIRTLQSRLLLAPSPELNRIVIGALARSKVAREVARLTGWKDKIWSRRYQGIRLAPALAEYQLSSFINDFTWADTALLRRSASGLNRA